MVCSFISFELLFAIGSTYMVQFTLLIPTPTSLLLMILPTMLIWENYLVNYQ